MKFLLLSSLLVASSLSALAHLEEDRDQSIARYGTVLAERDSALVELGNITIHELVFQKNGYSITVGLLDGKTGLIVFSKPDGSDLSDDEISALLEANADGKTWTQGPGTSFNKCWTRNDGAKAGYQDANKALVIFSATMLHVIEVAKKVEAQQKAQGL